jgi:hypothetical protein
MDHWFLILIFVLFLNHADFILYLIYPHLELNPLVIKYKTTAILMKLFVFPIGLIIMHQFYIKELSLVFFVVFILVLLNNLYAIKS